MRREVGIFAERPSILRRMQETNLGVNLSDPIKKMSIINIKNPILRKAICLVLAPIFVPVVALFCAVFKFFDAIGEASMLFVNAYKGRK